MSTDEIPVSVSAYARHRHLSKASVQKAVESRRLVESVFSEPGMPPRIITSIADVEWTRNTSPAAERSRPVESSSADDYRKSLVVERIVKTRLSQLRLDREQGRLVDAEDVRREHIAIARLIQNRFLELPDRIAAELSIETDPNRIRAILLREVRDILKKLSASIAGIEETSARVVRV